MSTAPLCGNLSALPSAPLLLCSPPWLRSFPPAHPPSLPVKGLPSVWKPFLLHSSLPLVQVPSLFFCLFCFFFLLPYPSTWGLSCILGGLTSSASVQWVFYRSSSTCRCISDVFVGRKVISASYSSAIFSESPGGAWPAVPTTVTASAARAPPVPAASVWPPSPRAPGQFRDGGGKRPRAGSSSSAETRALFRAQGVGLLSNNNLLI